jgi:hypothetical protein
VQLQQEKKATKVPIGAPRVKVRYMGNSLVENSDLEPPPPSSPSIFGEVKLPSKLFRDFAQLRF